MQAVTLLTNSMKQLLVDSDEYKVIKWSNLQSDAFKSPKNKSRSKQFFSEAKLAAQNFYLHYDFVNK